MWDGLICGSSLGAEVVRTKVLSKLGSPRLNIVEHCRIGLLAV